MKYLLVSAMALVLGTVAASAQSLDDLNIQIHGYAAQGFLYTTHNNAFYADSSNGSPAWTEAVVNVSANPQSALRVAVQARYWLLGTAGDKISLDWAAADYKVNDRFGVRFGKVKTPWGLFNETQDLDPMFLWSLLPQSIYDITTRNSDLSHYGGVGYGTVSLGPKFGDLDYRAWGGAAVVATDDGQFADFNDEGNAPKNSMVYSILGAAIHWKLPIRGLMIGASDTKANRTSVALTGGSADFAPWNNLSYFGIYEKSKLMIAGEWNRQAASDTLTLTGNAPEQQPEDPRGWYVMATYKLTPKFSAGVYDSQMVDRLHELGPDRYSKDWTVSARYDCNQYIYLKAEQHFIDGTALSFEDRDNPVLHPSSRLTALKIGVSF